MGQSRLPPISPFPCLDRCHTTCGAAEEKERTNSCPQGRCGKLQSALSVLNPLTVVGPKIGPFINPFGGRSLPVLRGLGGLGTLALVGLPVAASVYRHMKAVDYCLEDTSEAAWGIARDTGILAASHMAGLAAGLLVTGALGWAGIEAALIVFPLALGARTAATYWTSLNLYQSLEA